MNKPILIDSLYINMGGGKVLLDYLCERLIARGIDFVLLKDVRTGKLKCEENIPRIDILTANISVRKTYYKAHVNDYSSVFCFGNIPAPIKMPVPVYTYFHNINLLTLTDCRDWKQWLLFLLKRTYIRFYHKNTNMWFVQTSNTENEIIKHMGVSKDKVQILPFYKIPIYPTIDKPRTDYIFVGEYSGSKGHNELLEAWRILHYKGVDLNLHLTVSLGEDYLKKIEKAQGEGVRIINHGFIPREQLAMLYMQCKATVYPSYNESFGLGLIEAMEADCDVIASNRPYVYSICSPSAVFEPLLPESIADAVIKYDHGFTQKTVQKSFDCIDELIQFISN